MHILLIHLHFLGFLLVDNMSTLFLLSTLQTTYFPFSHFNQVIGVVSREYIPKGTRFGPLVGEFYTAENVPKDANRKYFWRVSSFVSETLNKVGVRKKRNNLSCSTDRLPV